MATPKIFISYRRDDEPGFSGRIYDRLAERFGRDAVFMDVDSIPPGADFVDHLERSVAEADVVLAIIGPGWLDARDADGRRRLDDPGDFVRIEIAAALAQGKRVIPVLVRGAAPPSAAALPEPLAPLARRNAVRIGAERFGSDADALADAIGPAPAAPLLEKRAGGVAKTIHAPAPDRGARARARWLGAGAGLAAILVLFIAMIIVGGVGISVWQLIVAVPMFVVAGAVIGGRVGRR